MAYGSCIRCRNRRCAFSICSATSSLVWRFRGYSDSRSKTHCVEQKRSSPAIIDFSPYWRPTAYASAIVIADALVWEGANRQVLDAVTHIGDFGQYLVRALIFRAVTDWIFSQEEPANSAAEHDPWERAVNLGILPYLGSKFLILGVIVLSVIKIHPHSEIAHRAASLS